MFQKIPKLELIRKIESDSKSRVSEYEITDAINNLRTKGYEVTFYFNQLTVNKNHMLYKRLTKNFSLKPIEGKFSVLFAEKKDEQMFPFVAILLVKNHGLDQKNDILGMKIVDPEIFSCIKKGVEKNG